MELLLLLLLVLLIPPELMVQLAEVFLTRISVPANTALFAEEEEVKLILRDISNTSASSFESLQIYSNAK